MFSKLPHIRAIVDHDGAVILDMRNDSMLTLNRTGGYVWTKFGEGESMHEIVHDLAWDTGEDPIVVEEDVRQFLDALLANQLIVCC